MSSFPSSCHSCRNYCSSTHLHCAVHPGGPAPEGCKDYAVGEKPAPPKVHYDRPESPAPTVPSGAIAAANNLRRNLESIDPSILDRAIANIDCVRAYLERIQPITSGYRPLGNRGTHQPSTMSFHIQSTLIDSTPDPPDIMDGFTMDEFTRSVTLALVNQSGQWLASIDRLRHAQELWMRCLLVGCTPQQIEQHQAVVTAIALSQLFFSNQQLYCAGLQLLYRNIAAGRSPFPSNDPRLNPEFWSRSNLHDQSQIPDPTNYSIWHWANSLWDIVAHDEGRPMPQQNKVRLPAEYAGFINVAQAKWSEVFDGSGVTENNDA